MANTYKDEFNKNFELWDIFSQQINREPSEVMKIKSFEGQVEYLTNWLTKRIDWLDKYYKNEVNDIGQ